MTEETIGIAGVPIDLSTRKIAIAFPSPDLISVEFHHCLIQLITNTSPYVKLGLTNSASSRITKNRINIVENARMMGATDILYIDSDTTFPVNALMTLLMHNKDIVCATTCRRKGLSKEAIGLALDGKPSEPSQRMIRMRQLGFPFMLIKMSVFDKLDEMGVAPEHTYFAEPPRWMMKKLGLETWGTDDLVGEDEYFCRLVIDAGFDIWCDLLLSMEIGHIGYSINYIEQPEVPDALKPEAKVDEAL